MLQDDLGKSPTDEVIKQESKIFGKDGKKITKWQEAVNEEAWKLATEEPVLVLHKGIEQSFYWWFNEIKKFAYKFKIEVIYEFTHICVCLR